MVSNTNHQISTTKNVSKYYNFVCRTFQKQMTYILLHFFIQNQLCKMSKYVVLVTGGSGFLGQHVVKHLQLYGDSVKEIRVLDKVPYEQKLGIGFFNLQV